MGTGISRKILALTIDELWERLKLYQGELFLTTKKLPFTYEIRGGEMFVDRRNKSITKATFHRALENGRKNPEEITGPKALNVFGAPYIFAILKFLGEEQTMVNRQRLIKNMTDQVKEAQLKLGYAAETVRLYYPLSSLNALLETEEPDLNSMLVLLRKSFAEEETNLGVLKFRSDGERIEAEIPPKGVACVHEQVEAPAFLSDLIALFQARHGVSLSEIRQVFERCSSDYVCEQMPEGSDFDYVMYFRDKGIDEYYYCIKEEMGHTIYHRFMEEDYRALWT